MLQNVKLGNILFLDIETVPAMPEFDKLSDRMKTLWEKKSKYIALQDETAEMTYERAGIYAEFGKIVCISVGNIILNDNTRKLRLKSFFGDDEKLIIQQFNNLLNNYFNRQQHLLCAHNGKEFDFPYIARRTLINGLKLPSLLNIAGKKPWEIQHLDTMELWKFGDYKHYTSLDLLTEVFCIPSPKDDMDGSEVSNVYWKEKDLFRITEYCEKDVVAIVQLFLKYLGESLILPEDIISVTDYQNDD